jgi:murein DD-endopeptidase MepM/ murein hydrolase activator NlpD
LLAIACCAIPRSGDAEVQPVERAAAAALVTTGADPIEQGGGFQSPPQDELDPSERGRIRDALQASCAALRQAGKLPSIAAVHPLFAWPIRAPNLDDFGDHGISNFVDHNATIGAVLDYNCGSRTYDVPGYNHQGTDIFTWPFPFLRLENSQIEVIAAASGTIILKSDGAYDHNCSLNGGTWNAVYVMHADGSVAWYGHLKKDSLTPKALGQTVVQGEYLGVVGSSGNSTGPHLHFEVYDAANQLIDPFAGPCNVGATWWKAQRPYYDSAINALYTHAAAPVFPPCPGTEVPHLSDSFAPGAVALFAAYYRDQQSGQVSQYEVRRPNGNSFATWSHSSPAAYYSASYWYWGFVLPADAPAGTWIFRVTYQGQIYEHRFMVGQVSETAGDAPPARLRLHPNEPNPFNPTTSITYEVPSRGPVALDVYDMRGRWVVRLDQGSRDAGSYHVRWDGNVRQGHPAPSGVYVLRLVTPSAAVSQRMVLVR